jgi:phage pi2 protein 07
MSDKEARALGAGSSIVVGTEEYKLSPMTMRQLAELQKTAVAYYKRQYLQTYQENADLLGNQRDAVLAEKLDEVAKWDIDSIPQKIAYDTSKIVVTDKLKQRIEALNGGVVFDKEDAKEDKRWKYILASLLDSGQMSAKEVETLTGSVPRRGSASYDMWWITGCPDGMISTVYESVRIHHPRIKKSDVSLWPMAKLMEASRIIDQLTTPDVGNT